MSTSSPESDSLSGGDASQPLEYLRGELAPEDREAFLSRLEADYTLREDVGELAAVVRALEADGLALDAELEAIPASRLLVVPSADQITGRRRDPVSLPVALSRVAAIVLTGIGLGLAAGWLTRDDAGPVAPSAQTGPASVAFPAEASQESLETSVRLARSFLIAAQSADGSWRPEGFRGDDSYAPGITALAVLTLRDDTAGKSQRAADRGLRYLLRQQQPSGLFGRDGPGALFNHSLATLAVLREAPRPGDTIWRSRRQRAVAYLLESGAWQGHVDRTSGAASSVSPDPTVCLWSLLALREACLVEVGSQSSELVAALERGRNWLARSGSPDAGTLLAAASEGSHWTAAAPRPSRAVFETTSERPYGALATVLLDSQVQPASWRDAVDELLRFSLKRRQLSLHDTSLVARALASSRLPGVRRQSDALKRQLLASQIRDGAHRGTWQPADPWSAAGGRIYTTAVAVLGLLATS